MKNPVEELASRLPADPTELDGFVVGLAYTARCASNTDPLIAATILKKLIELKTDVHIVRDLTGLRDILNVALND